MPVFTPTPTLRRFMLDDSFVRFVVGPLGSSKSTTMIIELARRMIEQAPNADGVRPTRFAVVRNTLQQIRQTCLADMKAWLGPVMNYKIYESTVYFDIPLPDGTKIESEWLLMPIDNADDTRRLLSLQLTGAWVSEFRELPYGIVSAILGRLGRYPRVGVVPTWYGLIGESNPFSDGSDWHEHLEVKLPSRWRFYRQPGGLDWNAENKEPGRLPPNYYENLIEGHEEEWVRVHVHAKNGDDLSGQTVFRRSFSDKLHLSEAPIQVARNRPLLIAQDLGRTPAALICQVDVFGRLLVLAELSSVDHGLYKFISDLLMPLLISERFAGCPVFVVMDPAGNQKSQLTEQNAADVFKTFSIPVMAATTNELQKRLQAVEGLMVGPLRGGAPGLIIDQFNCPLLVQAMKHHYRYKRRRTGEIDDTPAKTHPWSDLADALQYAALSVQLDLTGKYIRSRTIAAPQQVPFTAAAWT